MGWRDYVRHIDYLLLAASLGLVAYGVTMIYHATRPDVSGEPLYFVQQQVIAAVLGLVIAGVITVVDYEIYRRFQWLFYGLAVVMLIAVIPLGQEVNGARRWIDLGVTRFQPSAVAMLFIALALGAFLADRMELLGSRRVTATVLALVALPALLVYREPDFGSAVVVVMLALAMLYFYGAPWTHFAALFGAAAIAFAVALEVLPQVGIHLIKSYQVDRLLVFVDASRDPDGSGYNIIQSMIAVGAGSMTGRGSAATQTTLDFLPEHHTDFIFAVISERNGFVGATVLLILYCSGDLARLAHRHPVARHVRQHPRRRHRCGHPLPGLREHRHDDWYHAGDGYPAAVRQLWRDAHDRVPHARRPVAGDSSAGHHHAQQRGSSCPVV